MITDKEGVEKLQQAIDESSYIVFLVEQVYQRKAAFLISEVRMVSIVRNINIHLRK